MNSVLPIDGHLTGSTFLSQSGPGSYGYEGVIHILQTPGITITLSQFCVILNPTDPRPSFISVYKCLISIYNKYLLISIY